MSEQGSFVGLGAFLQRRGDHLLREAVLLTGSRESGEDLLQEALSRLLGQWQKVEDDPEGYLRRTLYNLAVDRWRYRAWRREVLVAEPPEREGRDITDSHLRPQNAKCETMEGYSGYSEIYDFEKNVLSKMQAKPNPYGQWGPTHFDQNIKGMQDAGYPMQIKHEQMDGRKVVRITFTTATKPMDDPEVRVTTAPDREVTYSVFILDEATGAPIETIEQQPYDFYYVGYYEIEKLPATEDNLKLLEAAAHPGAKVKWSKAGF